MTILRVATRVLGVGLLASLPASPTSAQGGAETGGAELLRTVTLLDHDVFEAYNTCNLERFATFFAEDVEFYHDQGGLSRSRQTLVESVRNNICGKVRREIVPGTLEVYPMRGYGALELGVHRFYPLAQEKAGPTGEARFVHLWQQAGGTWRITRVFSYDHHPLGQQDASGHPADGKER